MPQPELLKEVIAALDRLEIAHMLTGSFASSFQGYPRSSHDIDIVVEMQSSHIDPLIALFPPPRFLLSRTAMVDALRFRKKFTLQDQAEGNKVDLWTLRNSDFDRSRFGRRERAVVEGTSLYISRPEDAILQKLRWSEDCGGSEKQFVDARSVYNVQHSLLDLAYLERWAAELKVVPLWKRLLSEADPL